MTRDSAEKAAGLLDRLKIIERAMARGVTVRSIYNDDIADLISPAAFARMEAAIDAELKGEAAAIAESLALTR